MVHFNLSSTPELAISASYTDVPKACVDSLSCLCDEWVDILVDAQDISGKRGYLATFMIFQALEKLDMHRADRLLKIFETFADIPKTAIARFWRVMRLLSGTRLVTVWDCYCQMHQIPSGNELPAAIESEFS